MWEIDYMYFSGRVDLIYLEIIKEVKEKGSKIERGVLRTKFIFLLKF